MAIDSHMHINSLVTSNIEEEITKIQNDNNLEKVINVSLNLKTSQEIIQLAENNSKFFATIGIHPLYTEHEDYNLLEHYITSQKVIALGEIGLDTTKNNFAEQRKYLIAQIHIANNLHLPVIIHANNTNREILDIFKTIVKPQYGCLFHCFQPELDIAKELWELGIYISFAGRITYKTAKSSLEIASLVPNDLYLVETDAPYIAPEPLRQTINCSSNLKYIINKIAEIKHLTPEEVANQTKDNTLRLFKKIKY